ncbi:hypothetical protein B0H14DRAFT_2585542 [Mycena olivaceomarginata]|nr:hypothetical protein B0H14DRAFT_2585542 [Mycena olivaceomarginata]
MTPNPAGIQSIKVSTVGGAKPSVGLQALAMLKVARIVERCWVWQRQISYTPRCPNKAHRIRAEEIFNKWESLVEASGIAQFLTGFIDPSPPSNVASNMRHTYRRTKRTKVAYWRQYFNPHSNPKRWAVFSGQLLTNFRLQSKTVASTRPLQLVLNLCAASSLPKGKHSAATHATFQGATNPLHIPRRGIGAAGQTHPALHHSHALRVPGARDSD